MEFESFLPTGNPDKSLPAPPAAFALYSLGVNTNRDAWAYNFRRDDLKRNVSASMKFYNEEVGRYIHSGKPPDLDNFVGYDETRISWSRDLKQDLKRGRKAEFSEGKIRRSMYRPFCQQYFFFDRLFNEEVYLFHCIFPTQESENIVIWEKIGTEGPHYALAVNMIPNLMPQGGSQCFPFFTYAEDGTHRRENITDWALEQFRTHYHDRSITKWDIFHYIYAILHHPEYRARYAANLRRELPRIPFASASPVPSVVKDFEVFALLAKAGKRLAELHVHYEQQPEYKLTKTEKAGKKLDYRVTKMKLSKDKTTLTYNRFLTLSGIPNETYDYRLGNRCGLEWVIDQYQVSTDKRSGITNDPNRGDDPQYILRLIGQVITVSLETAKIVRALASLGLADAENITTA
ncbi:MAG TPA: type ISP restriction/modification enzyme [Candidatus Eremiobacteraceae bacterium]|nr:type ISP restriction/modification enzyme [Candidatus Eremiobacteraceae bacterium]